MCGLDSSNLAYIYPFRVILSADISTLATICLDVQIRIACIWHCVRYVDIIAQISQVLLLVLWAIANDLGDLDATRSSVSGKRESDN